jgi:hypothetical protein
LSVSRLPETVRRATSQLRPRYRTLTAGRRSLPDFVIVGAQKAATTSLMRYLKQHPDIVVEPGVGEVHFFDNHWAKGEHYYRSFFPPVARMERRREQTERVTLTGEKTPYYLMHPLVPERAARTIPHARLVAILRNPVDRAAAHHQMNVETGVETLALLDAIAAEPERIDGALARMTDGTDPGVRGPVPLYSYAARGRYAEQLDRWLQWFARDQLLVIRSEDLARDPDATYDRVLTHLDLAPHRPAFTRHNVARHEYAIDPAARAALDERFRDPNRELVDRYGIDWSAS